MNCGIQTMIEDRIVLSRQFLKYTDLQSDAVAEIRRIDEISKVISSFGNNCAKCMNLTSRDKRTEKYLSDQYYSVIGHEFRKYLSDNMTVKELRKAEFESARNVANQYVEHNIKTLLRGKPGENGMYLGKGEALFRSSLEKIERKTHG